MAKISAERDEGIKTKGSVEMMRERRTGNISKQRERK